MQPQTKFKIRAYIAYSLSENWIANFNFPNIRILNWTATIISLFLKFYTLSIIFILIGIILHFIGEWKSGRFIAWYRMKKYRQYRETLRKIRKERKEEIQSIQNPTPTPPPPIPFTKEEVSVMESSAELLKNARIENAREGGNLF